MNRQPLAPPIDPTPATVADGEASGEDRDRSRRVGLAVASLALVAISPPMLSTVGRWHIERWMGGPFLEAGLTIAGFVWVTSLPGAVVVSALSRAGHGSFSWVRATGYGLALHPLILLWQTTVGVGTNGVSWTVIGLVAAGVLLRYPPARSSFAWNKRWPILAIAAMTILLRWAPVSNEPAPRGIDSYQHALIAQMIVDDGTIPDGYEPVAPVATFTYHFGAHAMTAAVAQASGVPAHRAMLVLFPLLLAAVAIAAGRMTEVITGSIRSGIFATAVVGLCSMFPSWYMNWGRMPQTMGVVLLTFVIGEIAREAPSRGRILGVGILIAGCFLTHYRMAIVLFYGFIALIAWRAADRETRRALPYWLGCTATAGLTAIILAAPWLQRLATGFDFSGAAGTRLTGALPPVAYSDLRRLGPVWEVGTSRWLVGLLAVGIISMVIRREKALIFSLIWAGILIAFGNPRLVPVPWAGAVDIVTATSLLFLPASLPIATIATIGDPRRGHRSARPLLRRSAAALIAVVAIVGAMQTSTLVTQNRRYLTDRDLVAFDWINRNVDDDARFLTAMKLSPSGLIQPTDGGGWLGMFTGRRQSAPPMVYSAERSSKWLAPKILALLAVDPGSQDDIEHLVSEGWTHIYHGGRRTRELDPRALDRSPYLRTLYRDGMIRVYEIRNDDR